MTTTSDSGTRNDTCDSLEIVALHLDDFITAWEATGEPPLLSDFLPEQHTVRRIVLVELAKVDLEYRWKDPARRKRVFDYFREFPELREPLPCDLIYEEFHIRRQHGDQADAQEYFDAFPEQSDQIASLLGVDSPYECSSILRRNKQQRLEEVSLGDKVDDFELQAELGKGAFAKVYLARQVSMSRTVALKVAVDQSAEPQTLAQLDHEHIVRVYDQRVLPERQLRLLYMQYVAGGTLQPVVHRVRRTAPEERTGKLLLDAIDEQLLERGESKPVDSSTRAWLSSASWPEAVCWLGARLARALDYAHARGILHRDVKPANVLLTAEGWPKLADFNISFSSKLAGANPAAYFGGSLAYMSPEQLEACNPRHGREADTLDSRADLYSLGVVLWELLTGYRPFSDQEVSGWSNVLSTMTERRRNGVNGEALEAIPGCPAGLSSLMQTLLEPDRERRWASGEDLAHQLELCTKPAARKLLFEPPGGWRAWSRKYSVAIVLLAGGVPNVLAGAFNYVHNSTEIPDLDFGIFELTQTIINCTAYPLGLTLFWYLALSLRRGLARYARGEAVSDEDSQVYRRRALTIGHSVATISVLEWTIAAAAYPLSIRIAGGQLSPTSMAHFFFSLLLCGFVAAAYPFFVITFYSLRCLYPPFALRDLRGAAADADTLRRVKRWCWVYIAAAAVAPLLSIGVLIVASQVSNVLNTNALFSMGVFSVVGLIGLPPALWLFHSIQDDLDTLLEVSQQIKRRGG